MIYLDVNSKNFTDFDSALIRYLIPCKLFLNTIYRNDAIAITISCDRQVCFEKTVIYPPMSSEIVLDKRQISMILFVSAEMDAFLSY